MGKIHLSYTFVTDTVDRHLTFYSKCLRVWVDTYSK